ncbi:MAG: PqqD family protein [Solirubrobacteraceae bacterium]|nr:PqqD family protein [Solirubrobacteraceae bacterium]
MADRLRLRTDRLVFEQTGDEVVVLDLRTSSYLAINHTGRTLWPHLQDGATQTELTAILVAHHGTSQEVASADVDAFVASLRALDLLEG